MHLVRRTFHHCGGTHVVPAHQHQPWVVRVEGYTYIRRSHSVEDLTRGDVAVAVRAVLLVRVVVTAVAAGVRVRTAAAGSVAKSEEQLSTVQPWRGVVTASVVSGSRKSSEVGGATLCSTTTERVVTERVVNGE